METQTTNHLNANLEFKIELIEQPSTKFSTSRVLQKYDSPGTIYYRSMISFLIGQHSDIPGLRQVKTKVKDLQCEDQKQHIKHMWKYEESYCKMKGLIEYYRFYAQIPGIFNGDHFKAYVMYQNQINQLNHRKMKQIMKDTATESIDYSLLREPAEFSNWLIDLESKQNQQRGNNIGQQSSQIEGQKQQRDTHKSTETQSLYKLKSEMQRKYGQQNSSNLMITDKLFNFTKKTNKCLKKKKNPKKIHQFKCMSPKLVLYAVSPYIQSCAETTKIRIKTEGIKDEKKMGKNVLTNCQTDINLPAIESKSKCKLKMREKKDKNHLKVESTDLPVFRHNSDWDDAFRKDDKDKENRYQYGEAIKSKGVSNEHQSCNGKMLVKKLKNWEIAKKLAIDSNRRVQYASINRVGRDFKSVINYQKREKTDHKPRQNDKKMTKPTLSTSNYRSKHNSLYSFQELQGPSPWIAIKFKNKKEHLHADL